MAKLSEYAFVASILMTSLALVRYLAYAVSGLRAARMATAGGPARPRAPSGWSPARARPRSAGTRRSWRGSPP